MSLWIRLLRILRQLSFKRVRSAQKSVKPNFERVGTEELKFSVIAGSIAKQESLLRNASVSPPPFRQGRHALRAKL